MVVGIGKILKFNRKCTIVVGLLFAVIFLALMIVPGQADADGFTDEASGQTTTDEMYPEDTIEAYAGTLTNVLPTAGVAQADIITVCSSGCDYTSIQEAIDNASDGDTIEVHSGTYYENVRVNKELTIISESGNPDDTIVQAVDPGNEVFYVISDNVTINGFKVTGATSGLTFAINLHNIRNCSILNNKILDNWLGIWFSGSSNNTVANNIISNSEWGIYVKRSSNNNKLNNNSIISNQIGIYLEDTNNHTVNDNNFMNNKLGIDLDNSHNNNISGNNFAYNTIYGIYLQDSNGNHIYTNNFINNNNNAKSPNLTNNWNSTEPITYQYSGSTFINYVGNYWSDYTGSDSNSDGIGDTPYDINDSAGLQDEYPLIEPWEGVDLVHPYVTITFPANLATNVEIDTNITATFSALMNSSTLNNNTVKVYIQEEIAGETFEDTVGTWNSTNFQGFIYTEQLEISPQLIDGSYRTIGEENITYSTQPLLKDYQIYANEGIEVQSSGNYSVMGWLGDECVVIEKWVVSDLVFEQNSIDIKTLHSGETWDLGDGYSLKLLGLDVNGNEAWMALNNSSGEIQNEVCQNQSPCIFTTDTDLADDVTLFVTYLKKVNKTHIELKYTWLISQDIIKINSGSGPDIFYTFMSDDTIYLQNDEDVLLTRGITTPLFDDFKFEVEDTANVTYRLIRQTEIAVEGDISYNSSSNTVTFNPVSNLNENTDYFPLITTGAEDLAGNGLTEDYIWTFRTVDATPPKITDLNIVVTSSTASITWNTIGIPSNSTVKYNESGNLTILEKIDAEYVKSHAIYLDFLEANTTYYYYVISADQAGNTYESSIHNFTTSTVPVVTIHSPSSITNDSTPLLNATFDRIVTSAWYVLDGAAGIGGNYIDHLIITLPELSDGPHRVVVDAIDYEGDYMGNIGTAIQNFIVDSTLPIATITEPVEGAFIGGTLDIIGIANDTNFKNYKLEWKNSTSAWIEIQNSTEPVIDGILGSWNTVGLEDDDYMIRLIAMDNASNSNMILVNVTIDNTQPEVNITEPKNDSNLKFFENIVRGEVNDDNLYSAQLKVKNKTGETVNSYNIDITDSEFSKRVEFAPDQINTLELVAVDKAENSNSTNITVFVWNNTLINQTNVIKGVPVTIDAQNKTNTTIEFVSNVTISDVTFTVTAITNETQINNLNNSVFAIYDAMAVGKIVEINVTGLNATNESVVQSVTLYLNYTISDLDLDGDGTIETGELDEDNLYIYWHNGTNWTKSTKEDNPDWVIDNGQVKITGVDPGYVWAKVNHLSMFALAALPVAEPTEDSKDENGNGRGGGGGGGGASGEDFYNIVLSETDRQSVYKNSGISFSFDLKGNIVKHINFTALNSAGTVAAKVEILNNTSTLVSTPPPDEVYKNLNIWVGNYGWATEKNMADTTVSFTVEKSWVTDNNIDESSIALYRYSDDTWHELVTRKIAEDANSLQFEAETPGFSPFAVTGKTIGEPGGEGIIEPTVTAEKTPAPTPTEKKGIPGFSLFAGLSVLLIAVQLLRKKK